MRQAALVAAAAICALLAAPSTIDARSTAARRGRAASAPDVRRCVAYSQQAEDSGVTLSLENRCGRLLDCKLGWTLRCRSAKKGAREDESFTLARADKHEAWASAASCAGSGWAVGAIRWSCRAEQ
jgi:hypothetical protein